ncbi:hypothetical protein BMS3Abin10_01315 [bacterium BMS3Abin10]|nr:hypothetical protein BMS3Abin10_01315 [bacterium BMS3Abin10]GBE37536.1 hypothetical protein BMS3Bbin08_00126 [bacterium BMS3Bbin08]
MRWIDPRIRDIMDCNSEGFYTDRTKAFIFPFTLPIRDFFVGKGL